MRLLDKRIKIIYYSSIIVLICDLCGQEYIFGMLFRKTSHINHLIKALNLCQKETNMPEVKKTTSKTVTSSKKGTAETKKSSSLTASAERARKEALREEVLSVYSAKQNYRATTEMAKIEAEPSMPLDGGNVETVPEQKKTELHNAYSTPFLPREKTSSESLDKGEFDATDRPNKTPEIPQGKTFEEFSRKNSLEKEPTSTSENFNSDNYVGLGQKPTTPTKIIKEKSYSRSPRAEKIARFFSYLFTTKEGWYYILGTLCLVFIVILFFI